MRKKLIQNYFTDKKVGVVFSGGGARGFAHLGVMQYFDELGIQPCYFAGSSAGALVAVCLAAGKSAKETVDYFLEHNLLKSSFKLSTKGLLDATKIAKQVLQFAGVKNFEDLRVPLKINAMNINTGKEKVFAKGKLLPALQSTISLPLVFFPAKVDSLWYVDGSMLDVVPYHLLPKDCLRIALDVSIDPVKITSSSSQLSVVGNAILFAQKRGFSRDEFTQGDVYIRLKLPGFSLLEYSEKKHKEMVELGYKHSKKQLISFLKEKEL